MRIRVTSVLVTLSICVSAALAADDRLAAPVASDALLAGFRNPPGGARPRVWWHWMNGNITKPGIKADLEWMQRTGIGGFQNFDAALGTPQVVDQRLVYMTPEWKDAFHYATTLADKLGLEEAIAGSPGWSESGAPWVTPAEGMKKVVWTETAVQGGRAFSGKLPQPADVSGPLQNAPFIDMMAPPGSRAPTFYKDTVVIAFRVPDAEIAAAANVPVVTASGGSPEPALLADGDLVKSFALPVAPVGEMAWLRFEYPTPQTVRSVTISRNDHAFLEQFNGGPEGALIQASDDGVVFRHIVRLPRDGSSAEHTIAIPPTSARFFRAAFVTPPPPPAFMGGMDFSSLGFSLPPPATEIHIAELVFSAGARVHRFEEKAGFDNLPDFSLVATPAIPSELAVRKAEVVDLTRKMQPDGTLNWDAPAGHWIVQRFGYAPTGVTNHPASLEGTGLEVDKLSAKHVRDYMNRYLDNYKSAVGPLMGRRGLQYVISDSWEAGTQNWTEDMIAEFTKRRGYDPRPWFPALTGRVVDSSAKTDAFLWDYRRTLADLLIENHYDQISALLRARGMGHYGESHESGRAFIGDGMEAKRSNTVPMSAMWTQLPGVDNEQFGYNADIRESASVAHIYGQNLVAAESMTAALGPWSWSPETLKPTADKELAMGLNRFVIHTSVHQPLIDKGPGLGLGPFGQWFTRNETWSGAPAQAWISYLARSSFMLQQGRFVADVAYYYGEDSNLTALFGASGPPVPPSYNFDYVNGDVITHKLSVRGGELVTASGMHYRLLALDPRTVQMPLAVLKRLRDFVRDGAVVVGAKPVMSPSLADDPNEFRSIANAVWGSEGGTHKFGRGQVIAGQDIAAALDTLRVLPDFEYTKPAADTQVLAVHRRLADGDLYFVDHRVNRAESIEATFRVKGRIPELWHAQTGKISPTSYHVEGGRTIVLLPLEPWEAVFVVFRKPTALQSLAMPAYQYNTVQTLEAPWTVRFQPGRGAPESVVMQRLGSWSEQTDTGVKYFSGTGTYAHTLQADAAWFKPGSHLWLDLGDVKNTAEIRINGHDMGVLWKAPFRMDVTAVVHAGSNDVEIKVTNLWVNRMIGDRQPGVTEKITFTRPEFYKADSPLLPSGLLGPVTVVSQTLQ